MELVRGPEQMLVRQRGELLRHQLQVVSRVLHLLQLPRQVVPGIENNLHYMEKIEKIKRLKLESRIFISLQGVFFFPEKQWLLYKTWLIST